MPGRTRVACGSGRTPFTVSGADVTWQNPPSHCPVWSSHICSPFLPSSLLFPLCSPSLKEQDPSHPPPSAGAATLADTLLQWQRRDEAQRAGKKGAAGTQGGGSGGEGGAQGSAAVEEATAAGEQSPTDEVQEAVHRVETADSMDGFPSGLSQCIRIPGFDEALSSRDGSGVPLLKKVK